MEIGFLGAGYVGITTAAHFSSAHQVTIYDIDNDKLNQIENIKKRKVIGINSDNNFISNDNNDFYVHESDLIEKIKQNKDRLTITNDITKVLDKKDLVFIAVGTPPNSQGRANLEYIVEVAKSIGEHVNDDIIVLTKSTVPPGTGYMIEEIIQEELDKRNSNVKVIVGSCPEFLAEGTAMRDLHSPARIVFGIEDDEAREKIVEFFSNMYSPEKIVSGTVLESEMTKYIANTALASKLSFYNEIALFCDEIGADAKKVIKMVCKDPRIGDKFNRAGFGYGGSCFPKDTKAIAKYARLRNFPLEIIDSTIRVNDKVLDVFERKIISSFNNDLKGMNLALWGIGFKADTNDIRESRSVELAKKLIKRGVIIHGYDSISGAMDNFVIEMKKNNISNESYKLYNAQYDMFNNNSDPIIDGLIIGNESLPFRRIDFNRTRFRGKRIFDGKNQLREEQIRELQLKGFSYFSIGEDIYGKKQSEKIDKKRLVKLLKNNYMS